MIALGLLWRHLLFHTFWIMYSDWIMSDWIIYSDCSSSFFFYTPFGSCIQTAAAPLHPCSIPPAGRPPWVARLNMARTLAGAGAAALTPFSRTMATGPSYVAHRVCCVLCACLSVSWNSGLKCNWGTTTPFFVTCDACHEICTGSLMLQQGT
jgi:hypothetical protein